jgi:hypothetical protein
MRQLRTLVVAVANEVDSTKQRKLENTIFHLQDKVISLQKENTGLWATVNHEKKKRKRKKKLMEEFRAEEGQGVLFLSPLKIQAVRDLDARREQAKVDEQATKQLAKDQQQQDKIVKQQEALQKK